MPRNLRGLLLSAECHKTTSNNTSSNITTDFPDCTPDSYRNSTSELHLRREIAVRSQRNSQFRRGCNKSAATIRSMSKCQSSLLQNTGDHDTATNDESSDDHGTVDDDDTWTDAALLRVQQYYSVFHLRDHRRVRRQRDRSQVLSDPVGRKRLLADEPAVLSS